MKRLLANPDWTLISLGGYFTLPIVWWVVIHEDLSRSFICPGWVWHIDCSVGLSAYFLFIEFCELAKSVMSAVGIDAFPVYKQADFLYLLEQYPTRGGCIPIFALYDQRRTFCCWTGMDRSDVCACFDSIAIGQDQDQWGLSCDPKYYFPNDG